MKTQSDLLMASEAARILNRSAEGVRYYERTGKLPAVRTADGTRLFLRSDVERFAVELRAKENEREERPE